MDRETTQENPSLSLPNTTIKLEQSPRKPPLSGGANSSGGGDRLKRDEWSEAAVFTLLEAYEAKWVLRNRAKLKGQDWEDIAQFVSSRAVNNTNSPKTQTQCKNKIESMKKRYRSESCSVDASSSTSAWPLYSRLDLLLRGSASPLQTPPQLPPPPPPPPMSMLEPSLPLPKFIPQFLAATATAPAISPGTALNSRESNGGVQDMVLKENVEETKVSEEHISSDKNTMETDSSTPALYSEEDDIKPEKMENKRKRSRSRSSREDWDIADSIRWLAKVVVRTEKARMDSMRELEKMRAESESKRGEIELKRTEIIANTQLEIAKLFAGYCKGKSVDSSLRIGRN